MRKRRFYAMAFLLVAMLVAVPTKYLISQDMRPPLTYFVINDVSGSMNDRFPAPIQARLSDSTKLLDVQRRLSLLADHLPNNTRVIVTKFDHELSQVCDIKLSSVKQRKALRDAFTSITSREGSTFLWRTVDNQLALAQRIVESNPEARVRILLYTDGNDMENNPKYSHKTIIRKYGKILQSVVALDWVTIGYDLKGDVKSALKKQGVNFTRADQPADIVPLRAGFLLSKIKAKVGQEIGLHDQSLGVEINQRVVDWGDKTPYETGEVLRHSYKAPGVYLVRYEIRSASGKKDIASQQIVVSAPDPLKAELNLSKYIVKVGESFTVIDVTKGEVASRHFNYGVNKTSNSVSFAATFDSPGEKQIRLTVTDKYGQESNAVANISVELPAGPIAKIEASSTSVHVGEEIVFSDRSKGSVASRNWRHENFTSSDSTLRLSFDRADTHAVFLDVSDQFGQSSTTHINVTAKLPVGPKAGFRFSRDAVSPGDDVTLINQSSNAVRFLWTVDNEKVLVDEHPTLMVHRYGDIKIELEVWDRFDQPHSVSQVLAVPLPAKPTAAFKVPSYAKPGQDLLIEDESSGVIDGDGEWYLDDELVGSDRDVRVSPKTPGLHTVRRVVFGPGGTSELERELHVSSFELPRACLLYTSPSPRDRQKSRMPSSA